MSFFRFGYVNAQHSSSSHPEDCFVLDLHFQSCKGVGQVLDQIIPQCLDYLESSFGANKNIWLITGSGNHVPVNSHQAKGGLLFETVLTQVLARTGDSCSVSEGVDPNGDKGAVRIRKK